MSWRETNDGSQQLSARRKLTVGQSERVGSAGHAPSRLPGSRVWDKLVHLRHICWDSRPSE